jgi:glycosyltransferase involved in cell wall biosynthesis
MQYPLVSIIIPTYNRADFLKQTLESIANQTYQNFEVFVVDDGSPNDAAEIICAAFEKVYYTKIKNSGGPAKPRNVGILNAKGKYLAFVDDDDLWLPKKLETQVAILEQNLDFGLVHGCCEIINDKGELQNRIIGRLRNTLEKHGDVSEKMIGQWTVMMPTSFVRKSVIDTIGFFNEIMPPAGEDMEYWARCSFETPFYYLDEPLVHYRIHGKNISENEKAYIELPLHLKKVLNRAFVNGKIPPITYKMLNRRLGLLYLKSVKVKPLLVLFNMKTFDFLWFLRIKYLIRILKSI